MGSVVYRVWDSLEFLRVSGLQGLTAWGYVVLSVGLKGTG